MTTAADDRAVDEAFEACLAGRPVPGGAAGLAAFTGAVREVGAQPGRPNAALAELLATGLLIDQSSPSTRTAPAAGRSSRVRIRRRFAMFFPALLAKFLSAGAVAQAATGAGVVVVTVAGAGTVGVLPDPVQDTFTSLVGDEEVVEAPEDITDDTTGEDALVDEGESADPTEVPAVPVLDGEGGQDDDEAALEDPEAPTEPTEEELWAENGPVGGQSFGSWVAEGARNGWVDGTAVSEWAHKRNEERRRAAEEKPGEDVVATPEDAVDDGTADEGESEPSAVAPTERGADRKADAKPANGQKKKGNGRGNGRD